MKTLLFWIGLAILGFLLYISPGYLVHRMYEDFNVAKAPLKQTEPTSVNLKPSAPPKITPPSQNQIQNLQRLLDTPVLESPTAALAQRDAPAPVQQQQGGAGRQQPAEYDKIRSMPGNPATITTPNLSLGHGQSFQASMPTEISQVSRGSFGLYAPQRMQGTLTPAEVEYMRQIPQVPGYNPNCPDMRDYIRKDSIPCWGCKLR
jgi:hypothetical protein